MTIAPGTAFNRRKLGGNLTGAVCFFLTLVFGSTTDLLAQEHEKQMICLINQVRANHGLKRLRLNPNLAKCSRKHSRDMASRNYFSHLAPEGVNAGQRATANGYEWSAIGENLAAMESSPQMVMNSLLNSPSHRKVLLNPKYCEIGVGRAFNSASNYKFYWTQTFGRRGSGQGCSAPPSANGSCRGLADADASSGSGGSSGGGGCFITSSKDGPGSDNRVTAEVLPAEQFRIHRF